MKFNEMTNPWLEADVELLRKLVADNSSNAEISERMGRSVQAVKAKLSRMSLPARVKVQKGWPPEEVEQLLRLRDGARLGWSEIASRLNRPSGSVYGKYRDIKNAPVKNRVEVREPANAETHREWLRRMSLSPASLTAALFGDPLPGYSALDKRSA
jgi:hypothetical protein